jgi:hypothetical protein
VPVATVNQVLKSLDPAYRAEDRVSSYSPEHEAALR